MAEPVLEVERLTRRFGALCATDAVSLDLRVGEVHALIGPNGAGKSTLIKLIAGELAPDAGVVRLLGRDVAGVDAAGRARMGLARTFQVSSVVPEFTVLQNVVLSRIGATRRAFGLFRPALADRDITDRAAQAVVEAGLAGRELAPAATLSHGELRQLEIAMALALEPRAFLLDEPMAGMGGEAALRLSELLLRLRARAPMLLVEHDMDVVFALSDRISVLAEGRVIATGTAAEVRSHPEVRRVYLGDDAA